MDENQSLKILYITDTENRIIAIAPLRKSNYDLIHGIKYEVIEPLDYESATDYTGIILTEQKNKCLRIFLSYLYQQKDWDLIYLNDLPENSPVVDLMKKNCYPIPKFEIEKGAICPYITIPSSMDEFLQQHSRKLRKNLRRYLRKLQKDHGKVELRAYFELDTLEKTVSLFFNLHQKRWISKNQSGAFSKPKTRNIFMDRAKLFAEKGWFGLYFLTVDGKPIAAKYVLEHNNKMYACLSGFDPKYSSYSLGNLLLMKVIEKAIELKYSEYDFMKGNELYKFKWANNFRRNYDLKLFNYGIKSKLIHKSLKIKKRIVNLIDFFY